MAHLPRKQPTCCTKPTNKTSFLSYGCIPLHLYSESCFIMAKFLGIEFAPLSVPPERRLQTAVIGAHVFLACGAPVVFGSLLVFSLFTSYWWITAGYVLWILYDVKISNSARRGGRRSEWMRNSPHMRLYRDYFPIGLHKTVDLDPSRNYVFACHPHGILCASCFCNFGSEATEFSKKFPGIKSHLLTLEVNVMWPIARGYALWMGKEH